MARSSIASKSEPFVLTGPTASGKTALLLEVMAGRAEVVSADSVLVYRGLDIGTAKPTPEERQRLPHHLVDILDPKERMSLGLFLDLARQTLEDLAQRQKRAVISGGTVYYLRHLLYGQPQTPPIEPEIRQRVQRLLEEQGPSRLRLLLEEVDPPSAARIHPNDLYRITRALEVYWQTGRPLSDFRPLDRTSPSMPVFVVDVDRQRLGLRIRHRCEEMFRRGWVEEVKELLEAGYSPQDPGLMALGYAEIARDLQAGADPRRSLDEIVQKTFQYARRQLTFLRSLRGAVWVEDNPAALRKTLLQNGLLDLEDR